MDYKDDRSLQDFIRLALAAPKSDVPEPSPYQGGPILPWSGPRGREIWHWFLRATKVRGRPLRTAIAVIHVTGGDPLWQYEFPNKVGQRLGIPESSLRRHLRELEKGGLVKTSRHAGRCPWVTIILNPPQQEDRVYENGVQAKSVRH